MVGEASRSKTTDRFGSGWNSLRRLIHEPFLTAKTDSPRAGIPFSDNHTGVNETGSLKRIALAAMFDKRRYNVLEWFGRHWGRLKWPVTLAVLIWLFYRYRDGFSQFAEQPIQWRYLAVAFVLCGVSVLLTFYRWYLLVWAQDFPFRVRDAIRLGFIGYLFNYVAPGAVGGDLVKAMLIAREQQSRRTVAVLTVMLDRIVGLLALFLVGALASLLPTAVMQQPEMQTTAAVYWFGSLAGLLGISVLLIPAVVRFSWLKRLVRLPLVGRPFGEVINGVLLYQSRKRVLVLSLAVSVAGHFGMLSAFYYCGRAVSPVAECPDYISHLQFVPAAELAGVVVPLPGGIGALEQAMAYFYSLAGFRETAGFMTGISFRLLTVIVASIGATYYFAVRREIREVLSEQDTAAESIVEQTPAAESPLQTRP